MQKFIVMLISLPVLAFANVREVYVVDVQRVIDESELGKKSKTALENEAKSREAVLQKKAKEFEGEVASFEKQRAALSLDAAQDKAEILAKKEFELRRGARAEQEQYRRKQESELEQLHGKIVEATKKIANKEGYEFVVEKNKLFVVWVDSKYDITDKVIKELNG